MNILAADIGGTNARFALVEFLEGVGLRINVRRTYPSACFPTAQEAVLRFLKASGRPRVDAVSVAVAGPIRGGVATLTNLEWRMSETDLGGWAGVGRARLLNDFTAVGHALPLLEARDFTTIQVGAAHPSGVIALLGAGTGLGQSMIVPRPADGAIEIHPSEGGHASFAPRSPIEWELREFLSRRYGGHVSWERVLSGAGIEAVHDFLVTSARHPEDPGTREAMRDVDPVAVIVDRALRGSDPACVAALEMVIAAYGARAGDVALACGATGGVYLAGGITLRIRDHLGRAFLNSFLDKGRLRSWLEAVPVRAIGRDDAGLMGAAVAALPSGSRRAVLRLPPEEVEWGGQP